MSICDEGETVTGDGSGHGDIPATAKPPEFGPGVKIETTDMAISVNENLRFVALAMNRRTTPGRQIVSWLFPEDLAGLQIESGEKGVLQDVTLQENDAIMNDGRTGESPLSSRYPEESGVKNSEVLFPKQSSVEVVTIQPFRAEERHHALAVRCRSAIGVRGLGVPLVLGHALVANSFPDHFAGRLVDAV